MVCEPEAEVRYAVIGDEKRVDPRIPSQMTSFFLGEGGGGWPWTLRRCEQDQCKEEENKLEDSDMVMLAARMFIRRDCE